jgi:hypothetical protein
VMQVMPGTWDYVQQNLAAASRSTRLRDRQRARGRALPAPPAPGDRGRREHRDRRLLPGPRVRARRGLYDDTERYVDNVQALRSRFGG